MTGVLLTGATTPFGRRLAAALLDADPRLRVLAVGVEPVPPADLAGPRCAYVRADLTRPRELRSLLFGPARDHGIDVLVHGASHRSPRVAGRAAHALHVEATRELVALAESHPTLRRFVYRSFAEVYRIEGAQPALVTEQHPLEFSPDAPQWIRDHVEADVTVLARAGLSPLRIAVLRYAELLAPDCGSQLLDYLDTRVCLRPFGFDPMLNLLSLDDAVEATRLAVGSTAQGAFNVPGADVLPLSLVIERRGRLDLPVPGPLLAPLYRWRAGLLGLEFRYDLNMRRFHFGGVPDGRRAARELGYVPRHPIDWLRGRAGTPAPRTEATP